MLCVRGAPGRLWVQVSLLFAASRPDSERVSNKRLLASLRHLAQPIEKDVYTAVEIALDVRE